MYGANRFKIGMFGANCSGGRTMTKVPERWSGNWEDCLKLARLSDDAGLDFILPVATWKGHGGGETDYHGTTLETVTWAAGLLNATRRLTVFGTVHAPLFHPIMAAKQFVTADHIGQGRFGLNVVCGWNPNDFEMFGKVFQPDHKTRYEYAQEWIDAVKMMWSREEEFDFNGEYIKLKKVQSRPKPYGGTLPIIVNAGSSPTGERFAIRNFDAILTSTDKDTLEEHAAHVARIKGLARELGRETSVIACGGVTCRKTAKEAEEYHHYCCFEQADWGVIHNLVALFGATRESVGDKEYDRLCRTFALNGYGGFSIIGDPDMVAAGLANCANAGMDGIAVHMINYVNEFPFFSGEVLPRLERMGLRQPRGQA